MLELGEASFVSERGCRTLDVLLGAVTAVCAVAALYHPVRIGDTTVRAISQPGAKLLGIAWALIALVAVIAGVVGRPRWVPPAGLLLLGCATPLMLMVVPEGHWLFWRSPSALAAGASFIALGAGAFGLTSIAHVGSPVALFLGVLAVVATGVLLLPVMASLASMPYEEESVSIVDSSSYSGDYSVGQLVVWAVWLTSGFVIVAGALLGLGWGIVRGPESRRDRRDRRDPSRVSDPRGPSAQGLP